MDETLEQKSMCSPDLTIKVDANNWIQILFNGQCQKSTDGLSRCKVGKFTPRSGKCVVGICNGLPPGVKLNAWPRRSIILIIHMSCYFDKTRNGCICEAGTIISSHLQPRTRTDYL